MKRIYRSILFAAIPLLRWTARIGVILYLLWFTRYLRITVALLGCVIEGEIPLGLKEAVAVTAIILYFTGLLWAWKAEVRGGLTALGSTAALAATFDGLYAIQLIMMPIPAILFLAAHLLGWIGKEECWGDGPIERSATERIAAAIRWAARLLSVPYLFLLLAFLVEIVRQLQVPPPFMYGMMVYFIGLIISWKDEVLGGIIVICCVVALVLIAGEGLSPAYLVVMAPALFFITSHILGWLLTKEPLVHRHATG